MTEELELAEGALDDRNLRDGVAGGFQFVLDLIPQVGRVPDFVEQDVEKAFRGEEALSPQFLDRVVTHRHVGTPDVEDHVIVLIPANAFEPQPFHVVPPALRNGQF